MLVAALMMTACTDSADVAPPSSSTTTFPTATTTSTTGTTTTSTTLATTIAEPETSLLQETLPTSAGGLEAEIIVHLRLSGPYPGDFTASGPAVQAGLLCSEGETLEDFGSDWIGDDPPVGYYHWETQLTCADGSGVFYISAYGRNQSHPEGWDSSGPWNTVAGEGSDPNLIGQGIHTGECRRNYRGIMECTDRYLGMLWRADEP